MCHGTFDIVHPGHLRHLMYAKEKADLLIASVTADAHITKAAHRPYVPQELRAANLAALEIVDYVIIDPNATPIENIRALQPDFFAKGYEYFRASPCPPRPRRRSTRSSPTGARWCSRPATSSTRRRALITSTRRRTPGGQAHRPDGVGGHRPSTISRATLHDLSRHPRARGGRHHRGQLLALLAARRRAPSRRPSASGTSTPTPSRAARRWWRSTCRSLGRAGDPHHRAGRGRLAPDFVPTTWPRPGWACARSSIRPVPPP